MNFPILTEDYAIAPLRHRLDFRTVVGIHDRVQVISAPAACYDCHNGFVEVRPFNGRILCEWCIVKSQLRRP